MLRFTVSDIKDKTYNKEIFCLFISDCTSIHVAYLNTLCTLTDIHIYIHLGLNTTIVSINITRIPYLLILEKLYYIKKYKNILRNKHKMILR